MRYIVHKIFVFILLSMLSLHAAEIRLEVEDFAGKGKLFPGHCFSGRGLYGKWKKLTTTVEIPEAGLYYLWVRYNSNWHNYAKTLGELNARKLRYFEVSLNGEKRIIDTDLGTDYGWTVYRAALQKGKLKIELKRIGEDPYVDVLVLTKDFNDIPEPQKHLDNGRLVPDKIDGRPAIPPAVRKLSIPRSAAPAVAEQLVRLGGSPARYATTVRTRHDGKSVSFNFECFQPRETIFSNNNILWDGDSIELVIDGNRNLANIRHVIVNPDGKIYSEKITGNGTDKLWKPNWKITARIYPDRWTADFVIPLADLLDSFPEQPGKMRANFCRTNKQYGEPSTWSPMGHGFADPLACGELEFQDMTPEEWRALWIPVLNKRAEALDVPRIKQETSDLAVWKFEQNLDHLERARFAPPGNAEIIFEKMNLLPNPGFEYGKVMGGAVFPLNWFSAGSGTIELTPMARSGKNALKIHGTGNPFKIFPGCRPFIDSTLEYEWTGWVRGENATGTTALRIIWYLLDTEARGGWGQLKYGGESRLIFTPGPQWEKITLSAKPPAGTVRCEFEMLVSGNSGTLYCDDFAFDGMGKQPVDFLLPQPGFDAKANKKAVIWSRLPLQPEFELRSGKECILRGRLEKYGMSRWKGNAFYADISNFRTPGGYKLAVHANDREFVSPEFVIEPDLYLKQALLATNFYYIQRQGMDVPGWHKANFLDDAILIDRNTGKVVGHRDLAGGWQDAGDPSKQATADMSIYGLAEFFENTGITEYKLKEKYPDLLALDWVEVDRQINKCYAGDGKFYSFAVNNVSNANWIQNLDAGKYHTRTIHKLDPADWTDNIPNTWDDRFATYPPALQWMTSGLSKFALSIKRFDSDVAEKIARIMSEDYILRQKRQIEWKNDPAVRVARGDGELCRIAMHLHKLTGTPQYRTDADNYIREIIKTFDKKYYLSPHAHILNSGYDKWSYYNLAVPLFDYARYYPESPLLPEVKRVLREFVDKAFTARASDNEFGIVTHMTPGPGLRISNPPGAESAGVNRMIARYGYLMARAAHLFGDAQYLKPADAAAQWIVGRNPKGASMLIGNGWKFAATSTTLRYCQGHGDGVIPGAVVRGMTSREDTPPDFPALNIASNPGGCADSNMHEVFQDDTIAFLLLCQELYSIPR